MWQKVTSALFLYLYIFSSVEMSWISILNNVMCFSIINISSLNIALKPTKCDSLLTKNTCLPSGISSFHHNDNSETILNHKVMDRNIFEYLV